MIDLDADPDPTAVIIANGPLPPGFTRSVINIPPGRVRPYRPAEWAGVIVLIHHGDLELEGLGGLRSRFGAGSILHLERLPLRYIRNCGTQRAVLITVGRCNDDE